MDSESNGPRETLRDGNLKSSIWRNESENGAYYSATLSRTYKDKDGELRDTHSFSGPDLLRVSELARKSYERTQELRREERGQGPDRDQRREAFREGRSQGREQGNRRDRDR
ncbi:hypothetical protein J3E64_001151 [Sphingobium sp. OAS761]|uniref:hypothetical protein n=1 Tax=Sphingobium sp. OAS761 TaxID=2817901 RepID=UPI00209D2088|nr:hypothetical protein [Sphingobium sp. OAS761]MCP1469476.1 hypothetical protein [Sphingobium sp. OAS761]